MRQTMTRADDTMPRAGGLHHDRTGQRPLILASASPRRKALLAGLGLTFQAAASEADETVDPPQPPHRWVEILAERKALAVVPRWRDVVSDAPEPPLVVAADTIVVLDGEVLGKPQDEEAAVAMLSRLQGTTHTVYTGVCVADAADGRRVVRHSATRVTMRPLAADQIRRYVASGEPLDKAGAYAIQGIGAILVDRIEGDYFTVVGLPLALLAEMLASFGVQVL
ncbi:Maf-like protein [Alicyclobacillus cellulosilyticus]|uniref:dTTP/UTP pyrophosphatase n=1 Tax=Alicyclobacillus cellulosilyticus TaxID=1003997 RepID=A0A917K648_9BACL|nr:Maf family protein [Alicyclobacillus cellulosilyticus]GGJ01417.1 Maf-like protein [Alicyclobacillus cellulosilyticus]